MCGFLSSDLAWVGSRLGEGWMGPASAGPRGCLSWHGYLGEILTCVFDYCRPLGGMQAVGVGRYLAWPGKEAEG